MKRLLITGIAQETPLENPEENHIYIVFNYGECRVPTNEAGVQAIMEALAEGAEEDTPVVAPYQADAGVQVFGEEEGAPVQTNEEWLAQQEQAETSEPEPDNDYEINDGVGSI